MANLKEIRRRIASIKGTQKITRAMKMVSAAKLRKAQDRAMSFRSYADLTSSILSEVAKGSSPDDHPLLDRRDVDKSLILIISTDRGLCGGFNSNLNRMVHERMKNAALKPDLAIVGRKAKAFFERRNAVIQRYYSDIYDNPGFEAAAGIARVMAELYVEKRVDRIDLAFNEMVSIATQKPLIRQLLPIVPPEAKKEASGELGPAGFIFEPERKQLLGRLLPRYIEVEVYRALLESMAAEHAARMSAMDTATTNANEMIDHLTLVYNRARQSAITNELMDIVGGAEALND